MATIAELQAQRAENQVRVDRLRRAERLSRNPDFKKLILDEFCVQECARYAQNSANPGLDAEARADCLGIAQASGHLRRWLQVICQMGTHAQNEITEIDEVLEEMRAADLSDDTAGNDGDEQGEAA